MDAIKDMTFGLTVEKVKSLCRNNQVTVYDGDLIDHNDYVKVVKLIARRKYFMRLAKIRGRIAEHQFELSKAVKEYANLSVEIINDLDKELKEYDLDKTEESESAY